MKIEKIDGELFVILEENDRVSITTQEQLGKNNITIAKNEENIDIFGDSNFINSIQGEGMLEKVYIPPIVSKEEIVDRCDKWLDKFREVYDIFSSLASSDKYIQQKVVLNLSFPTFFSLKGKGNSISLDLIQYGIVIQEGLVISVDETDGDIYNYLIANVLDYVLSESYKNTSINYLDMDWNYSFCLQTPTSNKKTSTTFMTNLSPLCDSTNHSRIVTSILGNHNLGVESKQIISNLKDRITSRQLSDIFTSSIDYANKQYGYIVPDSEGEKPVVLNKK